MDKKTALEILLESYKAYDTLVSIVPKYVPAVVLKKEFSERDNLNTRLNRGIFEITHMITHSIHNELFKEFPGIKDEFYDIMDKKYGVDKTIGQ